MARPGTEAADTGTPARTVAAADPGGTPRVPSRRAWYLDAGLLGLLALVVRLPALFASRALTFDEGVYGSAVLAMRDGARPFREIFSSQGPLQLPLLWLDRKSTRLNSSHPSISYAVFCLKKKKKKP